MLKIRGDIPNLGRSEALPIFCLLEEHSASMDRIYLYCAILGGTVFVVQFTLSLIGMGGHDAHFGDHDSGHGEHTFLGLISLRSVVAALTFFGLCGIAASENRFGGWLSAAMAVGGGVLAMLSMGALMRFLSRLGADGTAHIQQAIGVCGTVYLSIPGNKSGAGKVLLNVQNRTMEYLAVSSTELPLPIGAKVIVIDVVSPDTVEVALASAENIAGEQLLNIETGANGKDRLSQKRNHV